MSASLSDTAFNFRLAQFVRQVSLQRSPSDLAGVVQLHACELLGCLEAELVCFDAEHAVLWRLDGSEDIAVDVGVLGAVARSHQGRRVLDTSVEPDFARASDRPETAQPESLIVEPVMDASGVLQAVLLVARPRSQPFTVLDQARLATVASSVGVFIQTLSAEQEYAQEHESLVVGAQDQLFNQEALGAHRLGIKAGPVIEVPNDGWWDLIRSAVHHLWSPRQETRLRFVQQLEAADCGVACLAMVLDHLGSELSVPEIRKRMNFGPSGVTLTAMLEFASRFGLLGRAIRVQSHQLDLLTTGMMLHWEFNHLVVFERTVPEGIILLDPRLGRRVVSTSEFTTSFTGVALEFFPDVNFAPGRQRGHPTFQYVMQLFQHPNLLRKALVSSLLVQAFGLALPLLTAVVIDRVLPQADLGLLGLVALGAVFGALCGAFADIARSYALVQLRAKFDQAATFKFVDHLLALPYTFFQQRSPGDLMLRVYANSSIREILSSTLLSAVLDGGMVIIYAMILLYLAPPLAIVAFVIGSLQVGLVFGTRRALSELMAAEWSSRSKANSKLVQVLHGIQTLKGAGAEAEGFRFWAGDFAEELNSVNKRQVYKARLDAVTHFFQGVSPIVMLCIGAFLVLQGTIPLGGMLAAATLSAAFLRPITELVKNSIAMLEVRVHVERIHDVVSTQPESTSGEVQSALPVGELELQTVSFTYPGQETPVLNGISLKVRPRKSVALVGETGCGKSTLIHLILGFYPCEAGSIRFDGLDSTSLNTKALRRRIGYVSQSPYLFEGSIRENIALSHPEASLAEIIEAARVACIHDDIMAMDSGYDTRLIANGDSVSGGQRQRIALARALLGKPKLLILDEATSAMDTVTEARLTRNLDQLNCTRVVVAHRLSTIRRADEICVIAEGKIIEFGTHAYLKAKGGAYARLVGAQVLEGTLA